MAREAAAFGLLHGFHGAALDGLLFAEVVHLLFRQRNAPKVHVLEAGFAQTFFQALDQGVGGAVRSEARLAHAPGVAEVDLVAPPLQNLAVSEHFRASAGIDVIDARLQAARNHFVAVLQKRRIVDVDVVGL